MNHKPPPHHIDIICTKCELHVLRPLQVVKHAHKLPQVVYARLLNPSGEKSNRRLDVPPLALALRNSSCAVTQWNSCARSSDRYSASVSSLTLNRCSRAGVAADLPLSPEKPVKVFSWYLIIQTLKLTGVE